MTVQRYIRKPQPGRGDDQFAARYEPGQPLDDLRTVAAMTSDEAEVAEVVFPSGKRDLLTWTLNFSDDGRMRTDYVTVEAGEYLAFSPGSEALYAASEANWRQFYDLATEVAQ